MELTSKVGPSNARGGEELGNGCKWNNKFILRNESSDEDAQNDDMKALNEQHSFGKPLSEEEKAKWSTRPSTLAASTHRSIQMAKLKTQLKVDAF